MARRMLGTDGNRKISAAADSNETRQDTALTTTRNG